MRQFDWKKWSFIPALLLIGATIILGFTVKWQVFDSPGGPVNEAATRNLKMMFFLPLIALQILFFVMMIAMDGGLRQLRARKYQIAGAMAAYNNALIFCTLKQQYGPPPTGGISLFWWGMIFALIMAAIAYALEWLRQPLPPEPEAATALPDLSNRIFCYYEHCNPLWINILLLLPAGAMLLLPSGSGRFPVMPLVIALVLMLFVGGFHVAVSRERFTVYFGLLKIKVLNLKLAEIKTAEVADYNLGREFGGWGIRYGSKCGWGFILGNRGIKLVTASGRRITVSMRQPEAALAIWQKSQ